MAIVITSGELVYRKRDTRDGEKSRLEILVWRAQVERAVEPSPSGEYVPSHDDGALLTEAPRPSGAHTPCKRPYPKAAGAGGFPESN